MKRVWRWLARAIVPDRALQWRWLNLAPGTITLPDRKVIRRD